MKINEILIGTHNKGKFKEIGQLLSKNIKKVSPVTLKIKSPKETGKNFKDNATLKANYFFKKSKIPVISDDSGLEIFSLKKKPGIYSARWAKKYGGFKNAMKRILIDLKNKKNRNAQFVCSLALRLNNKKYYVVEGKKKGTISKKILGKRGFGYDPIFIPEGKTKTFGQIPQSNKMRIDHRFLAFKKLKKKIKI